jgi:hypothetical protein
MWDAASGPTFHALRVSSPKHLRLTLRLTVRYSFLHRS